MIMKIRKMLLCFLAVQILVITFSAISHAATCSNNWRSPSSQTMETEIMTASMTDYADIERYLTVKQGWKTTHVYFLQGVLLVKGLDDDEINYDNIFWYPMMFMQSGVLSKAFPQGPCSITQKTPIALTEAEGEVVPESQGVIAYDYTLKGKQNVKHFKGVMKFTPKEAAPSDDTVVKGFKIVNRTKPYTVIGSKDMPVTTLGELRHALDAKKTPKEREKQAQRYQELSDIFAGKDTTKDTMKPEDIIMAPQQTTDLKDGNELYPLRITYKNWGYVNKAGQVVIAPIFDIAEFFQGRLARVRIDRKWGVIDKTGRFVIAPQYEEMGPFRDGLACVQKNGKTGFINESGKIIVPIENYNLMSEFKNGVAIILKERNGDRFFIDKNGNYITEDQFCEAAQCSYRKTPRSMQKDKKWGLVNAKNEFILQPQYDHIYKEKDGLFLVKKEERYGFIDKKGNFVIDLQFEDAHSFNEGLAAVKQNGKYGFIDTAGRFAIKPQFDYIHSFQNVPVGIDNNRERVSFVDGIAVAAVNKKYGVINKTGRYIAEPQFESAYLCRPASLGIVEIAKNGKWGLADRTGKILVEPQFDDIDTDLFHEYAIVSKFYKKGVVHIGGKIIIPTQYRNIVIYPNFAHQDAPSLLRIDNELPHMGYMDTSGTVFVMTDKVCGQYVVKNGKGEITWPRNIKELCEQKN
ncbi:MAG: WG repeat-containing protein [Syntrophaceae bacterium]|nr:WG repeat-containing protein [Syntrophaceae bacterium]